jgi:hypothetical protein
MACRIEACTVWLVDNLCIVILLPSRSIQTKKMNAGIECSYILLNEFVVLLHEGGDQDVFGRLHTYEQW